MSGCARTGLTSIIGRVPLHSDYVRFILYVGKQHCKRNDKSVKTAITHYKSLSAKRALCKI